jgi:glycine cleavage system H protein
MSEIPGDLKFLKSHEWARVEDDGKVTVGISDHAQGLLGDLVYVSCRVGDTRRGRQRRCAVVESVKAASDVYSPVSGQVVAVNEALSDKPETINEDAYGEGWIFVVAQPVRAIPGRDIFQDDGTRNARPGRTTPSCVEGSSPKSGDTEGACRGHAESRPDIRLVGAAPAGASTLPADGTENQGKGQRRSALFPNSRRCVRRRSDAAATKRISGRDLRWHRTCAPGGGEVFPSIGRRTDAQVALGQHRDHAAIPLHRAGVVHHAVTGVVVDAPAQAVAGGVQALAAPGRTADLGRACPTSGWCSVASSGAGSTSGGGRPARSATAPCRWRWR